MGTAVGSHAGGSDDCVGLTGAMRRCTLPWITGNVQRVGVALSELEIEDGAIEPGKHTLN
jgi:hypothetical protein